MMDWLLSLIPWWVYLLLAAAVVGVVWRVWGWQGAVAAAGGLMAVLAYGKGRDEGIRDERAKQSKARDNLQEHYDEIDRKPTDPDSAYERLRRMSGDKGGR